jgi:nitroimidazol reductase NimA-like FMN-containing flavoprotein (pyridoxamine 5'-phosphate oxidase superfamily)
MNKSKRKTKTEIKNDIIDFLNRTAGSADKKTGKHRCGMVHRNALVLATSYKDSPRATPLEFFNEGLTLYIFGEPGGKIANIKRNKKVCAAVYEQPLKHSKVQKSVQLFGKVELINVRNNPRLFKSKARKWNLYGVIDSFLKPYFKDNKVSEKEKKMMDDKLLKSINMIKITPDKVVLREYHPDFIMPKYEWIR